MKKAILPAAEGPTFGLLFIALLALLATPTLAQTHWTADPEAPLVIIENETYQYNPVVVADNAGGCFVIWADDGATIDDRRILARHITVDGAFTWGSEPLRVCTYESKQTRPQAVSDGSGGVLVVWVDEEVGTTDNTNLYAQRLTTAGRVWNSSGNSVCTAAGDQSYQTIAQDQAGGCFVSWSDERGVESDIYAQHVSSLGTAQWNTSGIVVCDAANDQGNSMVASDGAGGVYCVWRDLRDYSEGRITAQRLAGDGTPYWAEDGIPIMTVYFDHPTYVRQAMADGSGGLFVCVDWSTYDEAEYEYKYKSYILHVGADGDNLFPYGSEQPTSYSQYNGNAYLLADGEGGAFVVASYEAETGSGNVVRLQHFDTAGDRLWGRYGLDLGRDTLYQYAPRACPDGQGGLVVTWYDNRFDRQCAFAQRFSSAGLKLWPDTDIQISGNTFTDSAPPVMLSSGGWVKTLSTSSGNLHMQKLGPYGFLDDPRPAISAVRDVPNDQGGQVAVHWAASWLDGLQQPLVNEYSVWMRTPADKSAALSDAQAAALAETRNWPLDQVAEFNKSGWGYVTTVPAMLEAEYFAFAPTFGDSTGAGIPFTEYRVVAHSEQVWISWECLPAQGYSVDNLAPGVPLALAASRQPDRTVSLTWDAPAVDDGDLVRYAVYGAGSPGFALDEAHRLGWTATSAFSHDPGTDVHYYRVTALDAHGNEGPGSDEVRAAGVSAVPEAVTVTALHPNWPNPFNPATVIAFDLPRGGQAELAVFAVDGTRVRTLMDRWCEPGRQQVRWDGRDEAGHGVATGVYYYRLRTNGYERTRKMALIR